MSSWISDHFSEFAPSYDRVNGILSLGLDAGWRARLIKMIDPGPDLRILDLCAGTLSCTREALQRFPDATVTAVDICRPMLDLGISKLEKHARLSVEVICADALELDLRPRSYDAVICSMGMRHLPQQEKMMERVRGWLKDKGQFLILDFFRPATRTASFFHLTAGKYILPCAGKLLGGFGPAYLNLHNSISNFYSRHEYEHLLRKYSFFVRHSEDLTFGIVSLIAADSEGNCTG
jgi:demethylmenaquinone methyltransferase / 2-methoxy-6-polyprenyl-1,4-benzoquinol methylase